MTLEITKEQTIKIIKSYYKAYEGMDIDVSLMLEKVLEVIMKKHMPVLILV